MHSENTDILASTGTYRLKARSVRSGLVQLGARAIRVAIRIVTVMILARLLTPRDFGIMAMAASLFSFFRKFRDLGLKNAVVHWEEVRHEDLSTIFRLNVYMHLVILAIILLMTPVAAWFYKEPVLQIIIPVLTISFLMNGLCLQPQSLLIRKMRFGAQNTIQIVGIVVGTVLAILAAWAGWSYWALVVQQLCIAAINSSATWLVSGWRPTWRTTADKSLSSDVKDMLAYGVHLTASRIVVQLSSSLDKILIGYLGGASVLGLYEKAYKWSRGPDGHVGAPLQAVSLPALSQLRGEPERFRKYAMRALLPVSAVSMPCVAWLFVEAHNFILILLGNQWLNAVPFFRILCVGTFIASMSRLNKWLYQSEGNTKRQLQWSLISAPATILAIVIGARWGAMGIAIGVAASEALLTLPSILFCVRTSIMSLRSILAMVWRPALTSVAAAIVLVEWIPFLTWNSSLIGELMVRMIFYFSCYALWWTVLPGGRALIREMAGVFISAMRPKKAQDLEQV